MAAGVAVMGHVGLTPQTISTMGGFRPQGRSSQEAVRLLHEAHALQVLHRACAAHLVTKLSQGAKRSSRVCLHALSLDEVQHEGVNLSSPS